jgi:hypothetical protein
MVRRISSAEWYVDDIGKSIKERVKRLPTVRGSHPCKERKDGAPSVCGIATKVSQSWDITHNPS